MLPTPLKTRLAIIADPHLHDTHWQPLNSGLTEMVRSYADTAASTRVFNESGPAFRAALDKAVEEGAHIVLIPGDLTDDGQVHNIQAAMDLLRDYEMRHGLRFFACPGNHDFFALSGRPQTKSFLDRNGQAVSISSEIRAGSRHVPEAATLGTRTALELMGDLGYKPRPNDLHWETPFGQEPGFSARIAPSGSNLSCPMIDASYLVEPLPGLWLLSIDANICLPRAGADDLNDPSQFHDPTDAGWPALLQHRPYLFAWMRDVAARAVAQGNTLLAFSHCPALDPLAGSAAFERMLFGNKGLARRDPGLKVAEAFASTGIGIHFSGHLHVNDIARHRGATGQEFLNIAVPSPVGFPPAMKFVDIDGTSLRLRTVPLMTVPHHDLAYAAYRREADSNGSPPPDVAASTNHGQFIDRHLQDLIKRRYMPREWPEEMKTFTAEKSLADLWHLTLDTTPPRKAALVLLQTVIEDWYRLRKGGDIAQGFIPPERLAFYREMTRQIAGKASLPTDGNPATLVQKFELFLLLLERYLNRAPTIDVSVNLK